MDTYTQRDINRAVLKYMHNPPAVSAEKVGGVGQLKELIEKNSLLEKFDLLEIEYPIIISKYFDMIIPEVERQIETEKIFSGLKSYFAHYSVVYKTADYSGINPANLISLAKENDWPIVVVQRALSSDKDILFKELPAQAQ